MTLQCVTIISKWTGAGGENNYVWQPRIYELRRRKKDGRLRWKLVRPLIKGYKAQNAALNRAKMDAKRLGRPYITPNRYHMGGSCEVASGRPCLLRHITALAPYANDEEAAMLAAERIWISVEGDSRG